MFLVIKRSMSRKRAASSSAFSTRDLKLSMSSFVEAVESKNDFGEDTQPNNVGNGAELNNNGVDYNNINNNNNNNSNNNSNNNGDDRATDAVSHNDSGFQDNTMHEATTTKKRATGDDAKGRER
ncbi:hypothetical protein EDD21DRAFT_449463 [Dissophora ornata]|nr:hypothetical protein EDD21DRAFT_449463 [Dissophora ornata]